MSPPSPTTVVWGLLLICIAGGVVASAERANVSARNPLLPPQPPLNTKNMLPNHNQVTNPSDVRGRNIFNTIFDATVRIVKTIANRIIQLLVHLIVGVVRMLARFQRGSRKLIAQLYWFKVRFTVHTWRWLLSIMDSMFPILSASYIVDIPELLKWPEETFCVGAVQQYEGPKRTGMTQNSHYWHRSVVKPITIGLISDTHRQRLTVPGTPTSDAAWFTTLTFLPREDVAEDDIRKRVCGAINVGPTTVLTTASCPYGNHGPATSKLSRVYVRNGTGGATQWVSDLLANSRLHPHFNTRTLDNDLLLIRVSHPLPAFIKLSSPDEATPTALRIVGVTPDDLTTIQQYDVPVATWEACESTYTPEICRNTHFVFAPGGRTVLSGTPVLHGGTKHLYAFTSFTTSLSNPKRIDGFIKTIPYFEWIDRFVRDT